MPIKTDCEYGCRVLSAPSSGAAATSTSTRLVASVGVGGVNRPDDVMAVQGRLNAVPAARGGAAPPLVVDGLCGPLTRAAIGRYQTMQVPQAADGRIDPGGPTWTALCDEAGPVGSSTFATPPTGTRIGRREREAQRLAMAIASIPQSIEAARRARRTIEAARDYATLGPGLTLSEEPLRFVSKHFRMDGLGPVQTQSALHFLATIFRRMETVLKGRIGITGTEIFGRNLHDIDPFPGRLPAQVKAYVPRENSPELHPNRIYWCDGIDGHGIDRFVYMTLHELAHFVDEEDSGLAIVDHGYAFFGTVSGLTHRQRLHNADNYAMFAFDRAFGRERLVAMYPKLATWP
jgi:peptidoglycan hydrolase-like protein with peptidoglycan-binding domain